MLGGGIAGLDVERPGRHQLAADLLDDGLVRLCQVQREARPVLGVGTGGVVEVDLEDEVLVGLETHGDAARIEGCCVAGRPHLDDLGGGERGFHLAAHPTRVGSGAVERRADAVGVLEQDEVMDDAGVAGLELGALDPHVALEAELHVVAAVLVVDFLAHHRRALGPQLDVRLAVDPAAFEGRELARRRQIGGIAFDRAALGPRHDAVDLFLAQVLVALHRARVGVREPRRHLAQRDLLGDRLRPRAHLVVAAERHRPDLTGAVAALAAGLEDGRDVARVGDRGLGRVGLVRGGRAGDAGEHHGKDGRRGDDRARVLHGLPLVERAFQSARILMLRNLTSLP